MTRVTRSARSLARAKKQKGPRQARSRAISRANATMSSARKSGPASERETATGAAVPVLSGSAAGASATATA
eukprot:2412298-Alexandrium_andersonii.AAC.1